MGWQPWDRLRAYFRRGNVYQIDSNLQDQNDLLRIISGDEFIDFSKQQTLLQQTNLQINRLERYKDFDQMDEVGEITLSLDMYADEASLIDPEEGHPVVIKAKSSRVKEEIEELFYETLAIDRYLRPIARYLCKYGDYSSEIVLTKNRDAVQSLRFMNVYNFTRVETKFGDLVGFFYQDQLANAPTLLHPWQVMHLRLTTFENIYHPYGRSILDGARKDFKRLRLMEDAALIYRITRAPEKRIFSIPVGNIPPREVPQYIELISRQFKKRKFVDPATGNVNERYSPLIQEDDFFLPKRADGTGPSIDTLPGAENLDAIADIEYFKKKMISALKIPFSRVGIGEASEADGRSLASVSPEFAKAIQWIQREIAIGLKKVAIVHLALKGFSLEEIKGFDLQMTAASAIDELYRIETWNSRADIISRLKETQLFDDEWILRKFTTMTSDEVKEMQKKRALQPPPPEEGMGGAGLPPAPPIGAPIPLEHSDDDSEDYSNLITEYDEFEKRVSKTENVLSEGRFHKAKITSALAHLMDTNEFDGLPAPGNNGEKLAGWGVEQEERKEVLTENKDLIKSNGAIIVEYDEEEGADPQVVVYSRKVES